MAKPRIKYILIKRKEDTHEKNIMGVFSSLRKVKNNAEQQSAKCTTKESVSFVKLTEDTVYD